MTWRAGSWGGTGLEHGGPGQVPASSPPPVCSYRVYCLLGDGELSEGSVWEAMAFAGIYKLDNLVAILDINRLGQSEPAPLQHQLDVYQKRCEAFGYVQAVAGHLQPGSHGAGNLQVQGLRPEANESLFQVLTQFQTLGIRA